MQIQNLIIAFVYNNRTMCERCGWGYRKNTEPMPGHALCLRTDMLCLETINIKTFIIKVAAVYKQDPVVYGKPLSLPSICLE